MAKKRTYKKYRGHIINGMRVAWARYHPKYKEVLDAVRVELPSYKKDGGLAKKPSVRYKCNLCGSLNKSTEIDLDHVEPVVAIGKTTHDYTLDEYERRLDCNIDNLQILCSECHEKKSGLEREQRKEAKRNG